MREENWYRDADEQRDVEGGSRGSAQGFGSERICGAALAGRCGYRGGGAESGGGANDGAYVAGILHASEDHDQRSRVVCGGASDVVESESAWSDKSGDSLGMFSVGDAFEKPVGGEQDWDGDFGTIEILREAGALAFAGFAEQDGADGRGRAEGFFDEARTFDADGS